MNLEQLKARLAEIMNKVQTFEGLDDLSTEQIEEVNAFQAEYVEIKAKIEAKEKIEAMKAASSTSTRKTSPAAAPAAVVEASRTDKMGGFKSQGEFLMAVRNASQGKVDPRFNNTMFERSGEDGGFLVPDEMMSDVAKKLQSDESLLSRTRQFQVSGNSLSLPTDETAPWSGGVQAYWLAEGATHTESKNKFGLASWKLQKLGALVKVTDELLEDAVALESYMRASAGEAIMHKVNSAILNGDGVGKPVGLLNSGFKVSVAKESGQAADTIVARNVIKMYSRLLPAARVRAAWYINAGCEEQLRTMKDDQGNFIYLAPGSQMNQTPYGLLLGLPVIPLIGGAKALGDEGDIILADLSYYYTIVKVGGMKSAVSSHLLFDQDKQCYKFIMRIDGSCPFKSPVTTEFGNHQMSAIITLQDRA